MLLRKKHRFPRKQKGDRKETKRGKKETERAEDIKKKKGVFNTSFERKRKSKR